jgi:stearoyl-CoA desaturase (delta-9 desaturase)
VRVGSPKAQADFDTLQAVIANRYVIAATYARQLKATVSSELDKLRERAPNMSDMEVNLQKAMKRWLKQDRKDTPEQERERLDALLAESRVLDTVYNMRQELTALWERSSASKEQLLKQLQDWCNRAEASGIEALREFSLRLRGVGLA